MSIYRDGQEDIGVSLGQLNVDNLAVTLEGVSVRSFLHGYDSVGANWDRLVTSAAGLLIDTELPAAIAAADNMANPTAPQVLAHLMAFDGATWDRLTITAAGLVVDTELPAAAALTDNFANPTAPAVGSFLMVWDGATWDRAPGTSVDGLLVNLGANNDVDTELPAAVLLADNAATPTAPAVGSFGMMYDGATWDLVRGTSVDGLLVNLGANNDVTVTGTVTVDSELPAAALLADNAATPTAPAVGSFGMVFDGATWDFMRGTAVDGVLVNLGANNDVTITGAVDTELPAAAALTDDFANPTAPAVGAFLLGWDGTDWDRLISQGDNADGVTVSVRGVGRQKAEAYVFNATSWDRARSLQEPNAVAGRAVGVQAVGQSEGKATYRVVFSDLAAPIGVGVRIDGIAGKVVRVTKIQIAKPSVAQAPLRMIKTSTAGAGGTSTTPTPVPLDSADAAATGVVRLYTVAPAAGAAVGDVFNADVGTGDVTLEEFGSLQSQNGQALVLRGATQTLEINCSAAATLNGYVEWTEE